MKTLAKTKRARKQPLLHQNVQYHVAMFLQEYPPKDLKNSTGNFEMSS